MAYADDDSTIDAVESSALRSHDLRRLARIREGIKPGSRDSRGNGPLHLACHPSASAKVSLDFLREVLSWAPTSDVENAQGWTALALAVLFLPAEAVRLLVDLGRFQSGNSLNDALLLAANYERADVTAALLNSGAVCADDQYRSERFCFSLRIERHCRYLLELEGLAGRFPVLDREVAGQEQTDERALKLLANSKDRPTLREVARNPNTPTETLFALAPEFPRPFFSNPAFDWLLLENPDRILEMGKGVIRKIIRVKGCPASMIEWAVQHGSDPDRLAVLRRGDVSPETLRAIADKSEGRVRALAVAHDPEATWSALSSSAGVDTEADRLIASHKNSEPDLLEKLGNSADAKVRAALLENPRTPAATKLKISSGGLVVHVLRRRR
jgi:hypothetical protein